jgi:hypothetical protein
MRTWPWILAAALAVGIKWCGPGPGMRARTPGNYMATNDTITQRLRSAILSAGESCSVVTRTFLQGIDSGGEVWNVACRWGTEYVVSTSTAGRTQVARCATVEAATKNVCFKTFDAARSQR